MWSLGSTLFMLLFAGVPIGISLAGATAIGVLFDDFLKPDRGYSLDKVLPYPKYVNVSGVRLPDLKLPELKSISFDASSGTIDKAIRMTVEAADSSAIQFISVRLKGLNSRRTIPMNARFTEKKISGKF